MKYKIHKSKMVDFKDGSQWNGTLCGKLSSKTNDGYMNCTTKDSEVTCKLCIELIKKQKQGGG